jgi:hypothetical protein
MGNGQWAMGNGQPASQEQGMSLLQAFEATDLEANGSRLKVFIL